MLAQKGNTTTLGVGAFELQVDPQLDLGHVVRAARRLRDVLDAVSVEEVPAKRPTRIGAVEALLCSFFTCASHICNMHVQHL